jgi:hypothetical protein
MDRRSGGKPAFTALTCAKKFAYPKPVTVGIQPTTPFQTLRKSMQETC